MAHQKIIGYNILAKRAIETESGVNIDEALRNRQPVIVDLDVIRSGAAAGATAYQKPGDGIPSTDMTADVQHSLELANTAIQEHQDLSGYKQVQTPVDSPATSGTGDIAFINGIKQNAQGVIYDVTKQNIRTATTALDGLMPSADRANMERIADGINDGYFTMSSDELTWVEDEFCMPYEPLSTKTIRLEFSNPDFNPLSPNGHTWSYYTSSSAADNATWVRVETASTNQWDCHYDSSVWGNMFQYLSESSLGTTIRIIDSNLTGVTSISYLFYSSNALVGDVVLKFLDDIQYAASCFAGTSVTSLTLGDMPSLLSENSGNMLKSPVATYMKIGDLEAWTTGAQIAFDCPMLESIELGNLNNITSWGNKCIYDRGNRLSALKYVKIGDMPRATNISTVFWTSTEWMTGCADSLVTVEFGNLDSLTTTSKLFYYCGNLLMTTPFNIPNVTTTESMFEGCSNLSVAPAITTSSSLRNVAHMFGACRKLTRVGVFDTSNVTNMGFMFESCDMITTIPLFDSSHVSDMQSMFKGSGITAVPNLSYASVRNMYETFKNCLSLRAIPSMQISTSPQDIESMWEGCVNVESGIEDMYTYLRSLSTSSSHTLTFRNCGINTVSGSAELARVPTSWGGTAS